MLMVPEGIYRIPSQWGSISVVAEARSKIRQEVEPGYKTSTPPPKASITFLSISTIWGPRVHIHWSTGAIYHSSHHTSSLPGPWRSETLTGVELGAVESWSLQDQRETIEGKFLEGESCFCQEAELSMCPEKSWANFITNFQANWEQKAPHKETQLCHDMPVRWSLLSDDKLPGMLVTGNEVFLTVPLHKDYKRKKQSDSTDLHLISKGVQAINGVVCAEAAHWLRCARGVTRMW